MRLFIASPVKLYNYQSLIRDFSPLIEGRWVKENLLHLTWIFLGDQSRPESYLKKLQSIESLQRPINIEGLGSFGNPPRVFHIKASDPLLYKKARQMQEANLPLNRFKAHVTLCRIKKIKDYRGYREAIKKYEGVILGEILPKINLYESILSKDGAIYREIKAPL